MRPKFQSKQEVIINAPLEKVWEFNMDLSKITRETQDTLNAMKKSIESTTV